MNFIEPLRVYVPNAEGRKHLGYLSAGSAIVSTGQPISSDTILCHYEGNVYGAENLSAFGDRACNAAGRLLENYPTIAKGAMNPSWLSEVGEVDYREEPLPPGYEHYPKHLIQRFQRGPRLTFIASGKNRADLAAWLDGGE